MGDLYDFYCPHCLNRKWLPNNTTGRYQVRFGVEQVLIDKTDKNFYQLHLMNEYIDEEDGAQEKRLDTLVRNFIKYGHAYYLTEEEAREHGLREIPQRYEIWSNTPKHWKCPRCRHKMLLFPFTPPITVD